MAWTPEQQQAIDEEGKNIIVSAGAGSGKTAVLTARTLRKLQSGIHVNQVLILTFTNAAAAEMKERIRKAINKTPGLEEEANLIDGAYITTFDSFSLSMVKKYHTKLNVTNNIKITDEVVIDIKKNKILDEIMEENYLSPKQDFIKLIQDFCLKDDQELKDYILNIYKKIELKYDKEEFINTYIEQAYSKENINKFKEEYLNLLKSYQENIKDLLIKLNDYFDGDFVTKMEDVLLKLVSAKNYEEYKKEGIARGTIVKKDDAIIEAEKEIRLKKDLLKRKNQALLNKIDTEKKAYSEMTADEKLIYLEREKAYLLSLKEKPQTEEKSYNDRGAYRK